MRRIVSVVLALGLSGLGLTGCLEFGPSGGASSDDATAEPPDVTGSLGTFDMDLKLSATSCGVGALGMTNEWSLVVGLGRDAETGACTWDTGGGPVSGSCEDATHMVFDAKIVVDMRKGDDGTHPTCSIERHDVATVSTDASDAPTKATGSMRYTFTPTEGSNCADFFVGPSAQFATLPCTMEYAMSGTLAPAT
jgi:hypothetical protein